MAYEIIEASRGSRSARFASIPGLSSGLKVFDVAWAPITLKEAIEALEDENYADATAKFADLTATGLAFVPGGVPASVVIKAAVQCYEKRDRIRSILVGIRS